MKKIGHRIGMLTFAVVAIASTGMAMAQPTVYPFFHKVADYPEYSLRESPPPTRDTFGNRMHIKGGSLGDDFANHPFRGKVMRVEEKSMSTLYRVDQTRDQMLEAIAKGYYFRLAGFKVFRVKDVDPQNYNTRVESADSYSDVARELYKIWGSRYLGMHFGESDMSYLNLSHGHVFPFSRTRIGQTADFLDHYQWYGQQTGNRILSHHNGSLWQYAGSDVATALLGAQCFYRNSINPRVHYAFIRGMGKQYGLLWQGSHSGNPFWLTEKHKRNLEKKILAAGASLEPNAPFEKYNLREPAGRERRIYFHKVSDAESSVSAMRRLLYTMYMWNGVFMGWETGALKRGYNEAPELSPTGYMYNQFLKFQDKYGTPGVMQTPIALLVDYHCGWRAPEVKREAATFGVWTKLPYRAGDHLLLNIFNMLYPGHTNNSLHNSQRYFLPDTPYGDAADVLTHDVRPEVLKRYGVVVAANDLASDPLYTADKVEDYVRGGGQFVVTAENAAKMWPQWGVTPSYQIKAGARIVYPKKENIVEPDSFSFFTANNIPAGARAISTVEGRPLVYEIALGKGKITLVMSAFGINRDALSYIWPKREDIQKHHRGYTTEFDDLLNNDRMLPYPYVLTEHMRCVLDAAFRSQQLFSVGDGLSHIANRLGDGEYLVGIFNDALDTRPFKIQSHVGEIDAITERELLDLDLKREAFFFPHEFEDKLKQQVDDAHYISGSNVRIFHVKLKEEKVKQLAEMKPKAQPGGQYVKVHSVAHATQLLRVWPMFIQHLSGFVFGPEALLDYNARYLREASRLFNRNKVEIRVDAHGCSEKERVEILEKMKLFHRAELLGDDGATVYDRDYQSFDQLYADMQGATYRDWKTAPYRSEPQGKVQNQNANRYIVVRGNICSIANAVAHVDGFFDTFGGVIINSGYLYAASDARIAKDRDFIQRTGVSVVLDFSSAMQGYKEITFMPQQIYQYEWTQTYLKDVFSKMKRLRLRDALILPARLGPDKQAFQSGVENCARLARTAGVTLHWRNSVRMDLNRLRSALNALDIPNCKVALSTITTQGARSLRAELPEDIDFILLGRSTTAYSNNVIFPLSSGVGKRPDIGAATQSGKAVVLDAEYLSSAELERDLEMLSWR